MSGRILDPDPHLSLRIRIQEAYLYADPVTKHCLKVVTITTLISYKIKLTEIIHTQIRLESVKKLMRTWFKQLNNMTKQIFRIKNKKRSKHLVLKETEEQNEDYLEKLSVKLWFPWAATLAGSV